MFLSVITAGHSAIISPRHWKPLVLLVLALLSTGCATSRSELANPEIDPWEPFNRSVYSFNDAVDEAVLKPIAKGYDAVMPDGPQRGVRNFFENLEYPITFLNLVLQGKFNDSMVATGRFLMNSTLGLFGFFDVASRNGIPEFDEDFGQTMAVWGWKDSRYLVIPFLGPSTLRDAGGRPLDSYVSPVSYVAREDDVYWPLVLDLISLRAALLPFDKDLQTAADPYALMRDAFLQNREYLIYDGDPPAPDYDALLEEDLEDFD